MFYLLSPVIKTPIPFQLIVILFLLGLENLLTSLYIIANKIFVIEDNNQSLIRISEVYPQSPSQGRP